MRVSNSTCQVIASALLFLLLVGTGTKSHCQLSVGAGGSIAWYKFSPYKDLGYGEYSEFNSVSLFPRAVLSYRFKRFAGFLDYQYSFNAVRRGTIGLGVLYKPVKKFPLSIGLGIIKTRLTPLESSPYSPAWTWTRYRLLVVYEVSNVGGERGSLSFTFSYDRALNNRYQPTSYYPRTNTRFSGDILLAVAFNFNLTTPQQ